MINWKKGMGEFVGFTISLSLLLFIFVVFIGFAIMENAINTIENAVTTIERSVVVQETKEAAEEIADSEAKNILSFCKNIDASTIETKIQYVGNCDTWEKGQFAKLTVSAKIKTNDPFTSRIYKSNVLFMIERNIASEEESSDLSDLDNITTSGLEGWFQTLKSIADTLELNHFRYSNRNIKKSLSSAMDLQNKRTNCATAVSWAMQEYGALPTNCVFYYNHGLHKDSNWDSSKLKILDCGRKPANAGLQPGDIVCFQLTPSVGHIAIYAGKNSQGKRLWYSFGKEGTKENKNGSLFSSSKIGPVQHEYYNNHNITKIIRIKDLTDNSGSVIGNN